MLIITLIFEKNANFFAENCRKNQKIVIITSTPGKQVNEKIFLSIRLRWTIAPTNAAGLGLCYLNL
jgi:hypothetical protein